jgi:hypothetical protein
VQQRARDVDVWRRLGHDGLKDLRGHPRRETSERHQGAQSHTPGEDADQHEERQRTQRAELHDADEPRARACGQAVDQPEEPALHRPDVARAGDEDRRGEHRGRERGADPVARMAA